MFKRPISVALLSGLGAVASLPAQAANCAARDTVVERLESLYAEELTAGGMQGEDSETQVMEIWASPETGSFTVMVTSPQGVSCIVATGTNFFEARATPRPVGEAS